jgi:hypothetical protein
MLLNQKKAKAKDMLVVKLGRQKTEEKDREVEGAVASFVGLKTQMDVLNEKLKTAKEVLVSKGIEILKDEEAATVTFSVDDDNVQVTFGHDIKVKNEDALRNLLGSRFEDLVGSKVVFTPDKKLREMALKDTSLQECLNIKEKTPAVKVVK